MIGSQVLKFALALNVLEKRLVPTGLRRNKAPEMIWRLMHEAFRYSQGSR